MIYLEENFNEFLINLQVDNYEEITTSLNGIAKKLNKKYYNSSTEDNYLIVGSMGRNTSIKGESDIDVIYAFEKLMKHKISSLPVVDGDELIVVG